MAYFPHAFKKMLVATGAEPFPSDTTASGIPATTLALTAGQVGVVDAQTHLPVDLSVAPTYGATGAANEHSQVYVAQGSFYANDRIGPHHGGYQETVKTKGINPKYISEFYRVDSADAVNEVVEICTNSCEIACDTVYDLRIDIKGSPTLRLLTHNLYQTLSVYSGCCDDANNPIDPNLILLGWADQLNGNVVGNGSGNATIPFLNQFVQAIVWNETATTSATLVGVGAGGTDEIETTVDLSIAAPAAVVGDRLVVGGDVYYIGAIAGAVINLVDVNGDAVDVAAAGIAVTDSATLWQAIDLATYTPIVGAGATAVNGCLQILGAYVDTTFGDCSFDPKDHFEKEPIKIYASAVSYANNSNDLNGNPCDVSCFEIATAQQAVQGKGYGETLVRELILVKGYRQETWFDDARMREVNLDTVLGTSNGGGPEIARNASYSVYHLLHSVPRKSNPDGTLDNDQYLVKVVVPAANLALGAEFEAWMDAWLISANNAVQLQILL